MVLGIETSCDETGVALVSDGWTLIASKLASQIDVHRLFGGVVPEVASRQHLKALGPLVEEVLAEAGVGFEAVSAVGVCNRPGLVGALVVGVAAAKAYALALDVPIYGVDHLTAHCAANYLVEEPIEPPYLALIASGGHTQLNLFTDYTESQVLGATLDDAAGEAFDKVAKLMNLGYPGGPIIDQLAGQGDPKRAALPRAWLPGTWDFSFSGLKTAVFRLLESSEGKALSQADLAASFQWAVADVLSAKLVAAAEKEGLERIALAGGVAANSALRALATERAAVAGLRLWIPPLALCGDTGATIASLAWFEARVRPPDGLDLDAFATIKRRGARVLD